MSFKNAFPTSNQMLKMIQIGRICLGSGKLLGEWINEISYTEKNKKIYFFLAKLFRSGSKKEVTQIIHV